MNIDSWNLKFHTTHTTIWINMDQFQDCENSRIIIVLKFVSLFLMMECIPAKFYFNITDLLISQMSAIRISLSIDACRMSVVSMTFTKSIDYFLWWIIWHLVRIDTLLNLSKI